MEQGVFDLTPSHEERRARARAWNAMADKECVCGHLYACHAWSSDNIDHGCHRGRHTGDPCTCRRFVERDR